MIFSVLKHETKGNVGLDVSFFRWIFAEAFGSRFRYQLSCHRIYSLVMFCLEIYSKYRWIYARIFEELLVGRRIWSPSIDN